MWEILTFGHQQPYGELSDEEVIENCNHYYRSDGLEQDLPQPSGIKSCGKITLNYFKIKLMVCLHTTVLSFLRFIGCHKEIYDLMRECWNRDDSQRPAFREIHMFLQRKNMGYSPHMDKTCSPAIMSVGVHHSAAMADIPEC